jgi:hypothetical protein
MFKKFTGIYLTGLTPELTRPAQAAFNIMGQFNEEKNAITGAG